MTATECFLDVQPSPKFFAIEALREKRTNLATSTGKYLRLPHLEYLVWDPA